MREEALSNVVGFRKVIDHISGSGVIVVGHNCTFDFLHTTHKFIAPLPPVCARAPTNGAVVV